MFRNVNKLEICLFSLILAFSVSLLGYVQTLHIDLNIALNGWSPLGFISKIEHPNWYLADFPTGVEKNILSSYMLLYIYAYKYLHITPLALASLGVYLDIIYLTIISFIAIHFIKPQAPIVVKITFCLLMIGSSIRNCNLGFWGVPYYHFTPYSAADLFRIAGILLAINHRLILSGLLLAIAITIHPMMGLIGALFAFVAVIPYWKEYPKCQMSIAFILFLIIAGYWSLHLIPHQALMNNKIPNVQWISYTKIMNYHWYPIFRGMLSELQEYNLIPFLSFLLLLIFSIIYQQSITKIDKQILTACIVLLIICFFGLIFSLFPRPLLIKLALQRANDLFCFFGSIYIINMLYLITKNASSPKNLIAILTTLSCFFMTRGIPLIFPLLLGVLYFNKINNRSKILQKFFWSLLTFIIILCLVNLFRSDTTIFLNAAYTGYSIWHLLPFASILLWLLAISCLLLVRNSKKLFNIVWILIIGTAFSINNWSFHLIEPSTINYAKDYKALQLWAKANTPPNTIFMPAPENLSWIEYSERPTFGDIRSWLQNGWAYSSDYQWYHEGLQRFSEFGIPIQPYFNRFSWEQLWERLITVYYTKTGAWFNYMAKKYNIAYFVFRKEKIKTHYDMPLAYQNDSFVVYRSNIN